MSTATSETRYLWKNVENRPCQYCGVILPYWTKSDGPFDERRKGDNRCKGKPHPPIISRMTDAPGGVELVPVDVSDIHPSMCYDITTALTPAYTQMKE